MITFRPGTPDDIPFVSKHAYRLLEFGPPAWRDPAPMTEADIAHNTAAILSESDKVELLIAEDETGVPCGFLHMTLQTDYYTKEQHAHITDIVVIASMEGKGIGRALMEKADEWAKERGARWITLNVFDLNTHAQKVYEKAGYKKEWIKYLKEL